MMEQNEVDQIAYMVVGKKLREVAEEAANEAIRQVDVSKVIQDAFGIAMDDDLYDALAASASLIKNGGISYISVKDAQEIRWEQQEKSSDAMVMRFTGSAPANPPF